VEPLRTSALDPELAGCELADTAIGCGVGSTTVAGVARICAGTTADWVVADESVAAVVVLEADSFLTSRAVCPVTEALEEVPDGPLASLPDDRVVAGVRLKRLVPACCRNASMLSSVFASEAATVVLLGALLTALLSEELRD